MLLKKLIDNILHGSIIQAPLFNVRGIVMTAAAIAAKVIGD
jgi:hypothetical protein